MIDPKQTSSAADSDEQLARRAQAGCRASFEQLVRRFQVRLLRFLLKRVRCSADAEDLLQETFVRAFERLDRYDGDRSFGTWLFTIAHRLSVSHHRKRMTREAGQPLAAEAASHRSGPSEPGQDMAEREMRQRFWDAAASVLTEEQLSATWLFYVEEMPARQIAEVLGRSWVSIKTMLFRARKKLEPCLAAMEQGHSQPATPRPSGAAAWSM